MKIAVTSQNFKDVTGHAGRSRRFVIYDIKTPFDPPEIVWMDLPKEMSFHEYSGNEHPLNDIDVILTASAGQAFVAKFSQRGVQVVTCEEGDLRSAVRNFLAGTVKPSLPPSKTSALYPKQAIDSCRCAG